MEAAPRVLHVAKILLLGSGEVAEGSPCSVVGIKQEEVGFPKPEE